MWAPVLMLGIALGSVSTRPAAAQECILCALNWKAFRAESIKGCYSGFWAADSGNANGHFGICVTDIQGDAISGHLEFGGGFCGTAKIPYSSVVLKDDEATIRGLRSGCGKGVYTMKWHGSSWTGRYLDRYNGRLSAHKRK